MVAFYYLMSNVITLYIWALVIAVVMSWLITFNIVNVNSRAIQGIRFVLFRLTEPALAPIRRILPRLGGIDISPIILILLLVFLDDLLKEILLNG